MKDVLTVIVLALSLTIIPTYAQEFISIGNTSPNIHKVKPKHIIKALMDGYKIKKLKIFHVDKTLFKTKYVASTQIKFGLGIFYKGGGFGLGRDSTDISFKLRSSGKFRNELATAFTFSVIWP